MTNGTGSSGPEARYISVQDVEYELATGCAKTFRKHLLTTERLEIRQTLIPKAIELVDRIPKNETGKVIKRELRDRYAKDA